MPFALIVIPEGAPANDQVTGLGAIADTMKDSAAPGLPLTVPALTEGGKGAAIATVKTPCPLRPVLVSLAITVTL